MILIVLGMALVVSFLWILAMRWIAAPMIWARDKKIWLIDINVQHRQRNYDINCLFSRL
jgi:hypothetical protein